MARRWPWQTRIDRAKCEFAFFVSHVAEDSREVVALAQALAAEFQSAGGLPIQPCFLDINDWEHGNPPKAVIRKKIATSQFFVGWVTPRYLQAGRRGWVWLELAYAELVQLSQQPSIEFEFPFIVPVFRDVEIDELRRTPWLDYLPQELERSSAGEPIDRFLARFVPKLIVYYGQEMRKWAKGR